MVIHTNTTKILPVKTIIAVVAPILAATVKQEEPAIFSKAWEWDQMCNHCVD